jgi:cytochrome c2
MTRSNSAVGLLVVCWCAVATPGVADDARTPDHSSRRIRSVVSDTGEAVQISDKRAEDPSDDADSDSDEAATTENPTDKATGKATQPSGSQFSDQLVDRGQTAFSAACTQCHDAERSTSKRKDLPGWRATVQRMAGKSGADVPQGDREAIATYLASLNVRAANGSGAGPGKAAGPANDFSPQLVARGQAAFSSACTQCHDAERSTSKRKDLPGWRATVQRMAGKSGANVPQGDREAIATYLASLNAPAAGNGAGSAAATREQQQLTMFATFSPTFRGGNDQMELPGFMPQTWIGAAWTHATAPLSARATVCITCHIEPGNGHRVEFVEAAMRLDVARWLSKHETNTKVNVDGGRFIVPFGAFSAQANPAAYRTVSTPLIFNMGQRVQQANIGDPVLPMPYADQGALLNCSLPIGEKLNATFDSYVVNGLRGNSTGIDFYQSRNYVDNNKEPAVGGRVTFGGQWVRFGSSITSGRFNDDTGSGPHAQGLYYKIYGIDVTARYKDVLRFQFEYAQRDSDRIVALPGMLISRERIGGLYFEGEVRLFKKPRISFLMRYDMLNRDSVLPPPGSTLAGGDFSVTRTTYGLNTTLPGSSLLMLNLEQWRLPNPLHNLDVLGIRWVTTF